MDRPAFRLATTHIGLLCHPENSDAGVTCFRQRGSEPFELTGVHPPKERGILREKNYRVLASGGISMRERHDNVNPLPSKSEAKCDRPSMLPLQMSVTRFVGVENTEASPQ